MSFALLFSAFGYGLRHGFDWDHIAALTDISSVEKSKKRAFLLSSFYALGHAAVVIVLGVAIILADFTLPESVDTTLMYFIGFSLVALGIWVLTGIFSQGSSFRLKSRWMLIRDGLFKGVKRIQRTPSGRSVIVEHSHSHRHEGDVELHEHSHEPQSRDAVHHHVHKHELFLDQDSLSSPTAIGVGVLHGIGVELSLIHI